MTKHRKHAADGFTFETAKVPTEIMHAKNAEHKENKTPWHFVFFSHSTPLLCPQSDSMFSSQYADYKTNKPCFLNLPHF